MFIVNSIFFFLVSFYQKVRCKEVCQVQVCKHSARSSRTLALSSSAFLSLLPRRQQLVAVTALLL